MPREIHVLTSALSAVMRQKRTYIDPGNGEAAPGSGRYVARVNPATLHHLPLSGSGVIVITAWSARRRRRNPAPHSWNMITTHGDQPVIPVRAGRPFRLLLTGSTVSMLGTRMSTIAFPMLVLWVTSSPIAAGWMAFAATAPSILVYVPAGALVDLWPPRRVMLISEFGRGLAIASVVLMLCLGRPSIYLLISAAVAEETLEVFSTLAERRYVSLLAGHEKAESAMVQLEARTHIVVLTGRPLGGFLFTAMPILPFIADALTFVVSVAALLRIKRRQATSFIAAAPAKIFSLVRSAEAAGQHPAPGARASWRPASTGLWSDIREGWLWLNRDRFAQITIALSAATTLVCQALIMIFLDYAHSRQLSSLTIGIALAGSGLGGALGSVTAAALPPSAAHSWTSIRRYAWAFAILVLVTAEDLSFWRMTLVMGILGFTGALGNVELGTYLIQRAPVDMLARVTSVSRLMSFSACALGPMLGGLAIHHYGIRGALLLLSAAVSVMSIFSFLMPSGQQKETNERPVLAIMISGIAVLCDLVEIPGEILASVLALVRRLVRYKKVEAAFVPPASGEARHGTAGGPSMAFAAMTPESAIPAPGGQPGIGNAMYAE